MYTNNIFKLSKLLGSNNNPFYIIIHNIIQSKKDVYK